MKAPSILNTNKHTRICGRCVSYWKNGAGDGDRTRDIQLGKLAFYR